MKKAILKAGMVTLLVTAACATSAADGSGESLSLRDSVDQAKASLSDAMFGMDISGFGDVLSSYDDNARQKLGWGAFELNVEAEFSDDLQAALAVVFDSTGSEMTVGFLDYHTFGGRIAPRGRLWAEKGFHVQLGQFDVPFGNDWQFFASKDSVSISRPYTTDLVMEGGANDTGLRVLGNNGSVNFNSFLLRGFNRGHQVGGRLGLTPFSDPFSLKGAQEPKAFELGFSYLYDSDTSWRKNEAAWGVDAEASSGNWVGRFEYLVRKKELRIDESGTTTRGWHLTQEFAVGEESALPTTLFARYERGIVSPSEVSVQGADAGDERDERVVAGFSSNIGGSDLVLWKFEVQHFRAATSSTKEMPGFGRRLFWYTQLVVTL